MPGIRPARKSFPTEAPLTIAYMSIGTEGGMIIPMVEDATVMPAAKPLGYPFFTISGIRIDPRAEVSATDEPEIPPKIIDATTFTSPRPPLSGLTKSIEKSMSLRVNPLWFISSPVSMNSGMAMMMKLSVPDQTRWGKVSRNVGLLRSIYRMPLVPMA
ncbi:hypothetical protein SDC9_110784 [bioreactor metagenome]|uniref:Uncharacterized protein n=1 Tax=bioreactor metagenome TaxID=1076179 RepID=A0A645BEM7_9ZZZZ